MKPISQFISLVFHPLFIPIYLLAFTLHLPVYAMQRYPDVFKLYLLGYVIVLNVIIPIISLLIMKRYRIISTLTLDDAKERKLPFVMMFFIYTTTAFSLMNISGLDGIITLAFITTSTILLIVLILNQFLKISAHAASVAAGATWFFVLFEAFGYNTVFHLLSGILAVGLVMSSRLYLKAHTPREVYLGALAGFSITLLLGELFIGF